MGPVVSHRCLARQQTTLVALQRSPAYANRRPHGKCVDERTMGEREDRAQSNQNHKKWETGVLNTAALSRVTT